MIFPAIALFFGAQAGGESAPVEPTAEEIAACEAKFGDSYGIFACLGIDPEVSEEEYEAYRESISGPAECPGPNSVECAPLDEVIDSIAARPPSDYYLLATRLFHQEDRKEDALFWYYAGQLRWRMRLECNPPAPGGEGALFGAMNSVVGEELNAFAASNIDLWLRTIDAVLAWDRATPARYAEDRGAECDAALENQRKGLADLRQYIETDLADIEAEVSGRRTPDEDTDTANSED